jgi:hypothetical protein
MYSESLEGFVFYTAMDANHCFLVRVHQVAMHESAVPWRFRWKLLN